MDTIVNNAQQDPFEAEATPQVAPAATQVPPQVEAPPRPRPSIDDRSVCLVVELTRIGGMRQVRETGAIVADGTDASMLRVQKALFDSERLKNIGQLDTEIRQWLYKKALPSFFKSGVYRLPIASIEAAEEKLRYFALRRQALVDAFLSEYEREIQTSAERLGPLFNPNDYPVRSDVGEKFKLRWRYVSFGTPTVLQEIKASLWDEERQKARAETEEAVEQIRKCLRMGMAELVDHMVGKLTETGPDGKKKIFRNSMVNNFREFLADFNARNIADDTDLSALVDQAKSLLDGVDPDELRKDGDIRMTVSEGMVAIKQCLDGMLTNRTDRAITFDEVS